MVWGDVSAALLEHGEHFRSALANHVARSAGERSAHGPIPVWIIPSETSHDHLKEGLELLHKPGIQVVVLTGRVLAAWGIDVLHALELCKELTNLIKALYPLWIVCANLWLDQGIVFTELGLQVLGIRNTRLEQVHHGLTLDSSCLRVWVHDCVKCVLCLLVRRRLREDV